MNKSCENIISKNGDENENQKIMLNCFNNVSVQKQMSTSHSAAAGTIITGQCTEITGRVI